MDHSITLYRLLSGPDDATFCHRVSDALSRGWQLFGSPTMAYDSDRKTVIAAQAIIKIKPGGTYSADLDLSNE
jgi:hypothetical protein